MSTEAILTIASMVISAFVGLISTMVAGLVTVITLWLKIQADRNARVIDQIHTSVNSTAAALAARAKERDSEIETLKQAIRVLEDNALKLIH